MVTQSGYNADCLENSIVFDSFYQLKLHVQED